jgi:hypothetical protein
MSPTLHPWRALNFALYGYLVTMKKGEDTKEEDSSTGLIPPRIDSIGKFVRHRDDYKIRRRHPNK